MTTTKDISSSLAHAKNHLQLEAEKVGATAIKAAQDQVIQPAIRAANQVTDAAQKTIEHTREAWSRHASHATSLATDKCDQVVSWAKQNPLLTLGIAFGAGILVAKSALTASRNA